MSDEPSNSQDPARSENNERSAQPDPLVPAGLAPALRAAGFDPSDPKFTRALEISLKFFSGQNVLPPAEHVAPWEELYPGISNKIVEWTEEQAAHRRSLERLRVERAEARMDRGQLTAVSVAISGLILAAIVGIWGSSLAAIFIALFAVGGPTAALAIAMRLKKPGS